MKVGKLGPLLSVMPSDAPVTVFKHSVIKRSDGNDVTVWVHQSFTEDMATPAKRSVKPLAHWQEATGVSSSGPNNAGLDRGAIGRTLISTET